MSQLKKGAILSYITIVLSNAIGLVLTPFIIKQLGQSEYGLYILLGSLVAYISLIDFGLNNTVVRFIAKFRANADANGEKNFLATVLIIYFVISSIVILLGFIFYFNIDLIFDKLNESEIGTAKTLLLLLIFNLAISLPGGVFTGICNGYEKFVFPRASKIVRYLVRSLLVFTILTYGGKSISMVVIDTVLNVLLIIVTFYYVVNVLKVKIKLIKIERSQIRTIFTYSIWIFIFVIQSKLLWQSGQMILGITVSTEAVAIFAVGIVLSGYFGAFAGGINGVFLPKATFMIEKKSNREELTNMFIKIGRIVTTILMFVWGGFLLFGHNFILLWVGKDYEDSYMISLIIMTAYILPLVQSFANSVIEATGNFKFKAKVYFITISLGVIIGGYLSKFYGYWAIAWVYSFFWILAQIIMNWYFDKVLNIDVILFFKQTFGKLALTLIISFVAGYFINNYLGQDWHAFILKACLYTAVYMVSAYFLMLNNYEKQLFSPLKFFK